MLPLTPNKHLLVVEDSPSQLDLITEALQHKSQDYYLHSVHNGEEALDFLYGRSNYTHAPRPDMIILDLNLPRINGWEMLSKIKADPRLKLIPVVVFTTSDADADILKCYSLEANCYVVKPKDVDEFFQFVQAIEYFWLKIATLPRG